MPLIPLACNTLAGIESARPGLCPDGSRADGTNCDDAGTPGTGGSTSEGATSGGPTTACDLPWQRRDTVNGRCYLQEYGPRDWFSAEQRCLDLGGHLVALDSANELGALAEWVGPEVWIGGTDGFNEGKFIWTNGQPWTFSSWKDGLPLDPSGNRDCVMLETTNGSLPVFECRLCSEKRPYVCESSPINP